MYNVTSVLDDRVETLGAFLHIIPKLIPGDKFWTSIFLQMFAITIKKTFKRQLLNFQLLNNQYYLVVNNRNC